MKYLRERCEKLVKRIRADHPMAVSELQHFAREIRNEALEEAAKISDQAERDDVEGGICSWVSDEVRKLKTHALANSVSKDTEVKGQ